MVNTRDEKRISLRVSPELYEKIVSAAHDKNLSVNAFIIQELEAAVEIPLSGVLDEMMDRIKAIEEIAKDWIVANKDKA